MWFTWPSYADFKLKTFYVFLFQKRGRGQTWVFFRNKTKDETWKNEMVTKYYLGKGDMISWREVWFMVKQEASMVDGWFVFYRWFGLFKYHWFTTMIDSTGCRWMINGWFILRLFKRGQFTMIQTNSVQPASNNTLITNQNVIIVIFYKCVK